MPNTESALYSRQRGVALLVSLVFLLLLSMIGIGAMQSATYQEKMAASVRFSHESLQVAESALRVGEVWLQEQWPSLAECHSAVQCLPPAESLTQASPGTGVSRVHWVQVTDGLYGVQNIGSSMSPANLPSINDATLYRVTGIGVRGAYRTVLESIYARFQMPEGDVSAAPYFRRVMWRQIQ